MTDEEVERQKLKLDEQLFGDNSVGTTSIRMGKVLYNEFFKRGWVTIRLIQNHVTSGCFECAGYGDKYFVTSHPEAPVVGFVVVAQEKLERPNPTAGAAPST